MTPLAIVLPVKNPLLGKSRLKSIMSDDDRQAFNCWLYHRTFDQVAALRDEANIYVVSKSHEGLEAASRRGFVACSEPEHCELNSAIATAARRAEADGSTAIMVLPIDLPLLTTESLRRTIARFDTGADMLLIEDRIGSGTNLLLWRPLAAARFLFGPDSAAAHIELARRTGLRAIALRDANLSFDLDTPADVKEWIRMSEAALPAHIAFRTHSALSRATDAPA
jgi:2-phospho-L-lactate guanylyltransferase